MVEPWPKERIEALLRSEDYSYQRIELPHGLMTPGKARAASAAQIFPDDLTGKTVLDLGCNHGFFCFEAVKRGAARVVGIDYSPEIIRRAKLLAEAMGVTVEFEVRDINHQPITERFDYVLCLNLLHHLDDPLLQLDRLMRAADERLVLEVAGVSLFDYVRRLEVMPLFGFLMGAFPVIYVARVAAKRDAPAKLKYYFTRKAMRRLFAFRSDLYPTVEFPRSPHKGRYLVIAHRRRG
ncbi:MAG: methyltransferase domain-containing protein [Alphaproteobacteria bacterium]|nr:methyltransferase domain-containing protein [Alphaproteobacteria bacterium]